MFEIGSGELEAETQAPTFAEPESISFSPQEQEDIADMIVRLYGDNVIARQPWYNRHMNYDLMYRGQVEEFSPRDGPWEGSSHLHIQLPYWLCDSIHARRMHAIFSQTPLVQGYWEEDQDEETAKDAAALVEWHLQAKRMNCADEWSRAVMTSNVHGEGVLQLSYVQDFQSFRTMEQPDPETPEDLERMLNPDGMPQLDDLGDPIDLPVEQEAKAQTRTLYHGPVVYHKSWDDIIRPLDARNLQPKRLKNPGGADWVIVRDFELLSQMLKKQDTVYTELLDKNRNKQWWIDNASDQTRSGQSRTGGSNNDRTRQEDAIDGINRSQSMSRLPQARPNPEFETLCYYGPFEHPETGEDEEMVIFISQRPKVFLGAFLLSDLVWTGERPLIRLPYKVVSDRGYPMGVCELSEHLSEEIDTLHNMRIDIGQATNMPWAFVKHSAYIKPAEIQLRPLELVPVDDPNAVVYPRFANVTSFYYQEEQTLLSIVERVMGVTDLFLGVAPTRGAAARHATGFLGTQQEAEARMAEPLRQDAEAFGRMCKMIYDLEMQYGPEYRSFRLEGKEGPLNNKGLTRDDLWFRGQYDFRLGANVGMFSQLNQFQRAQTLMQFVGQSPLAMQDMGRHWEMMNEMGRAMGYSEKEMFKFIGPKDAVSPGSPRPPSEENAILTQYGDVNVNPGDNDDQHLSEHMRFMASDPFQAMANPNLMGFLAHIQAHEQQKSMKALQQQMAQVQAAQGPQGPQGGQAPGQPQGAGADPMAQAQAQMNNVPVNGDAGGLGQMMGGPQPGATGRGQ
jgi:hypothetical protein